MESTIMKKTYINPTLEVVKIQTQQMLAVSARGIEDEVAGKTGDYYDDARGDGYDW